MTGPVILVVDDEAIVREAISDFLRNKFEADVRAFGDGDQVMSFLRKNKADLMILDIKMPKKSGLNVIKESKKILPGLDIVVVSAWISSDVAAEAISAGAADYIGKPLDLKILELKISDILSKRRA